MARSRDREIRTREIVHRATITSTHRAAIGVTRLKRGAIVDKLHACMIGSARLTCTGQPHV